MRSQPKAPRLRPNLLILSVSWCHASSVPASAVTIRPRDVRVTPQYDYMTPLWRPANSSEPHEKPQPQIQQVLGSNTRNIDVHCCLSVALLQANHIVKSSSPKYLVLRSKIQGMKMFEQAVLCSVFRRKNQKQYLFIFIGKNSKNNRLNLFSRNRQSVLCASERQSLIFRLEQSWRFQIISALVV